jgi:ribosomal-protein-alanine N-acetyltransferase
MSIIKVFQSFPVIDIGKYVLRELQVTDAQDFLSYMKDDKVYEFIAEEYIPKTLSESEEEIQYWADLYTSKRSIYWGIALKSTNTLIGSCGFNVWSPMNKRAEISYDLSRKFWNQGIMTQSIKAICDFVFCNLEVNRVQATVAIENIASVKLLEKVGFKREGILREYAYLHGRKHNSYMYSYLRKDSFSF